MLRQILGQAKKHPSVSFLGVGTLATLTDWLVRTGMDSWDRKNNPEPWNKLGPNDQYKFYSVNVDYSKLKKEGPDF
ncbi:NADH dehydrogenase [ubiquinone] 1 alpha subcomplex subunit 4-like protein [Cricetulus griseus]|nr:NADH dehydrogenase [ubiquinone] 1 alpha subcomplex subunit 4-like protein [Cricetulus griseus]